MSEHQYVAFRAIDAPVSPANLKYMRSQSSHAEVTSQAFDSEYHYGDFHGNALEMLRRGYDFHLHYANFGDRTLMFRFPCGLPGAQIYKRAFDKDSFDLVKDKQGAGEILRMMPAYEAGSLDELWDFEQWVDDLLPIRADLLNGDLRPLYLAHLAVMSDMNHDADVKDAAVPAGLSKLTKPQAKLAEWFGLDDKLLKLAAKGSPALPASVGAKAPYASWVKEQPEKTKNEWLTELIEDPAAPVFQKMRSAYLKGHPASIWPMVEVDRTVRDLMVGAGIWEAE